MQLSPLKASLYSNGTNNNQRSYCGDGQAGVIAIAVTRKYILIMPCSE